jgi:hypothetical protein
VVLLLAYLLLLAHRVDHNRPYRRQESMYRARILSEPRTRPRRWPCRKFGHLHPGQLGEDLVTRFASRLNR